MQEIPVALQGYYFAITLALGAVVGVLFDFYRTCRYFRRPRRSWGFFFDLLFFLVVTLVVYTGLLLANWGEVRIYVFVGLTLGFLLYLLVFSRSFLRLFRFLLRCLFRVLEGVGRIVRSVAIFFAGRAMIPARPFLKLGRWAVRKLAKGRASLRQAGGKALKRAKKALNIFPGKKS